MHDVKAGSAITSGSNANSNSCFISENKFVGIVVALFHQAEVLYETNHEQVAPRMAFQVVHSLNETESTGYLTLYAGGTLDIDQDITFTLEPDEELLGEYNLLNYDLDTDKYAKRLDPSKYTIESYSVTMKQGGEMPYALLPIKIRPEGLSPDSLYTIEVDRRFSL